MALRPTVADLAAFAGIALPAEVGGAPTPLEEMFNAALALVERRVSTRLTGWLATGNPYPEEVRAAVLLQGSRLNKRRLTPEGVTANLGGLGQVRVTALDPDVEALLTYWLNMEGFA